MTDAQYGMSFSYDWERQRDLINYPCWVYQGGPDEIQRAVEFEGSARRILQHRDVHSRSFLSVRECDINRTKLNILPWQHSCRIAFFFHPRTLWNKDETKNLSNNFLTGSAFNLFGDIIMKNPCLANEQLSWLLTWLLVISVMRSDQQCSFV